MSIFNLQSIFLIAVAYLLGALIGCGIRKMFKHSASMLHRASNEPAAVEPANLVAVATAGAELAGGGSRFAGEEGEASIEIKRPEVRDEISSEVAGGIVPDVRAEPSSDIRVEMPKEVLITVAAINMPVERETISYVEPEIKPVIVEPILDDDLTKIKGVGLPVALELKKIGIARFEQVAQWSDHDIADISQKLGFSGRIERENWMAQAQILAMGDELEFTTHQLTEAEIDHPSNEIDKLISGARARGANDRSQGDDLKRIVGVGTNIEAMLNKIGVNYFSQISAWSPEDIAAVSEQLGIDGRIDRENWVQQAKNLESVDH